MSSDFCIDPAAEPRRYGSQTVLRATLLVLLGLVASYGLGQISGPTALSGPAADSTAAPLPLEDWHGNVRRSAGGW